MDLEKEVNTPQANRLGKWAEFKTDTSKCEFPHAHEQYTSDMYNFILRFHLLLLQ